MFIFHWCSHYTSLNIYTDLLGMVIAGLYKCRSTVQMRNGDAISVCLYCMNTNWWSRCWEHFKMILRVKNGHYSFIPTFPSNTPQGLFTVHSLIVCWSQQLGEKKDTGAVWSSMIQQTQYSQGPSEHRRNGRMLSVQQSMHSHDNGSVPTTHPLGMKFLYW